MQPDHPGSCAPEVPMDAAAAESMNLEEFDQIILETEDYDIFQKFFIRF